MNRDETGALLAVISAADKRRMFDDLDVTTWFHLLHDLQFADARDAVLAHYRDSSLSVMPAEVRDRVWKVRAQRRASVVQPHPPFDPDTEQALCREWGMAWNDAICDGATVDEASAAASRAVTAPLAGLYPNPGRYIPPDHPSRHSGSQTVGGE